jgi:hypothetical protein
VIGRSYITPLNKDLFEPKLGNNGKKQDVDGVMLINGTLDFNMLKSLPIGKYIHLCGYVKNK